MNRSASWTTLLLAALQVGCAGSPLAISRMSPQEITSVSNTDLCYAYDRGQSEKPVVRDEVQRRRLNCGRVLVQADIEPTGAAMLAAEQLPPDGDCSGIEYMGVYVTEPVYGIRGQFAKVRNKANFTKIVEVSFVEAGTRRVARSEVGPGAIESIRLAVSDRPVTGVRLTACR